MKFSLLFKLISLIIKIRFKLNKNLRDMVKNKEQKFVITTREWKKGVRFIIDKGTFTTDSIFDEYDMALVWRDGNTAFKIMTSGDPVGILKAVANRDLELKGNTRHWLWFTVFLGFATGVFKRK